MFLDKENPLSQNLNLARKKRKWVRYFIKWHVLRIIITLLEKVEEFEYPDDLAEFQLVSQIELKPKKRETLIFTIDEHRKECSINLSYFIQRYEGQKDKVSKNSLNKNQ